MLKNQFGTLYVVSTPIGNLLDITLRAIETLKSVSLIAAEDTRHSAKLLKHYGIATPTLALHDHNESTRVDKIIKELEKGNSIALISDAGTPLISDPGYRLVSVAKTQGIQVVPIPGACAAIAALSAAGLATDKFIFVGFLPTRIEAMQKVLADLYYEDKTIIFYVAPHHLQTTLMQMLKVFGEERVGTIARELTKLYESINTDTLKNLYDYYESHPEEQCGEIVILISGNKTQLEKIPIVADHVLGILLETLPVKQAASLTSKITGVGKNELYERALFMKSSKQ